MPASQDSAPSATSAPQTVARGVREDLRIRRRNIAGLFRSPATRAIIIVTAAVLVAAVGMSYMNISHTSPESGDQSALPSSVNVGTAPKVNHQPGVNETQRHAQLQREANQRRYEEAAKNTQTVIPTLTANTSDTQALTLPSNPTKQNDQGKTLDINVPAKQTEQAPVAPPPAPVQTTPEPAQQAKPESNKAMDDRVAAYLAMWGPTGKSLGYQEYNPTASRKNDNQGGSMTGMLQQPVQKVSSLVNQAGSNSVAPSVRYVRAGTSVPGILITPLDSDKPGPVLAQITSGPLAGARLIGSMNVKETGIEADFSTISKPGWPKSYSIKAVAMDQANSTALATYINHHYLAKGIGLLAGSFLEGYGQAMQQQGNTTVIDPSGGVVTQTDQLNSHQIMRTAQGNVAQHIGQTMEQTSNVRPTTIRAEGAHGQPLPIRILFLKDF